MTLPCTEAFFPELNLRYSKESQEYIHTLYHGASLDAHCRVSACAVSAGPSSRIKLLHVQKVEEFELGSTGTSLGRNSGFKALVDKPHKVTQCVSRSYRGKEGKLYLRIIGGTDSQVWNMTKEYSNGVHNEDTIRFPRNRADVVALMYHKPVKRIPEEVMKKASVAVLKSGLRDVYNMTTTDCMLNGKGISRHIKPWFEIIIRSKGIVQRI
ncbi:hypothetical protein MRX96_020638 [Rhipicephalus microplus]